MFNVKTSKQNKFLQFFLRDYNYKYINILNEIRGNITKNITPKTNLTL